MTERESMERIHVRTIARANEARRREFTPAYRRRVTLRISSEKAVNHAAGYPWPAGAGPRNPLVFGLPLV